MILVLNPKFMRALHWEQTRHRFSQQVRGLRHARGWTQGQLAKKAGLTLRDVWRLENGYLKHISLKTLTQISNAFDVAIDIRFSSLKQSLKAIGQPVHLPASFDEEISSQPGETA